jgi:hypothetical protein
MRGARTAGHEVAFRAGEVLRDVEGLRGVVVLPEAEVRSALLGAGTGRGVGVSSGEEANAAALPT